MRLVYVVHIAAGTLVLLSGYVALYATKGASLHRKAGILFVFAMMAMCVAGSVLAALRWSYWSVINLSAGSLTAYLVITSFVTVRIPAGWTTRIDAGLMLLAFGIGLTMLTLGVSAITNGGRWNGIPAFPFFLFAFVGLTGSGGDFRVMRSGALTGTPRLTRHLWRMTFALFIAAMSFFIGQMKVIPKPIRIPGLLALPVVAVLVTLLYWLWRVRIKRSLRGIVSVGSQKVVRPV